MENPSCADVDVADTADDATPAPSKVADAPTNPSPPPAPAAVNTVDNNDPPISKNQLKKRRRWEKSMAVKKRRKEQEREVRRLKAERDGRDLAAERVQQLQNEKDGKGWARREEKWKQILQKADIDNSFRVCFDCAFEDQMTFKETNSLSLQLRYVYSVNRRSSMPVYIDVCGVKRGGSTWGGMKKVEGFPERWVGRAFRCYEGGLDEVYGSSAVAGNDDGTVAVANKVGERCEEKVKDGNDPPAKSDDTTIISVGNKDSNNDDSQGEQPYPKLPPNHQFVYLAGDSPNTLTTLDNNTTYIIGGIVDRNRLKRAAIERAESITAQHPSLNIQTARLPLDENCDFKGSTRILTCNHVFEILQKYRENGYKDWRSAIMAVLPCRKDVDEKDGVKEEDVAVEERIDAGKEDGSDNGNIS
ncbi:hypothetical protein ACHAXR_004361 [Thalassiosira sp. AJA248-18]